jgi:type II secretory pathway pseudopilin PulG
MVQSKLRKYQIGLAAIALFTLIIVIVVLVQAGATKQDADTTKKADDIATKLEAYVSSNQKVPTSLDDVGVGDVPASISYQKLSDTSYKFCLTYKSASSGFDATSAVTELASGGQGSPDNSFSDSPSTATSYLYIPSTHHKGQNCQTIKPYLSSDSSSYYNYNDTSSGSSLLDTYTGIQSKARDTERTTDLKTLQSQIEASYAMNGNYPTLAEINDATWRSQNMQGLDSESLKDPQGSSTTLVATPAAKAYAYQPVDDNGKACTVDTDCQAYTLTAKLEGGSDLVLDSLN